MVMIVITIIIMQFLFYAYYVLRMIRIKKIIKLKLKVGKLTNNMNSNIKCKLCQTAFHRLFKYQVHNYRIIIDYVYKKHKTL